VVQGDICHVSNLFKDLNILPLPCMHVSEILCHIKVRIEKLEQNAAIHNHNTYQNWISVFSSVEQMPSRKV
jgi:hypothetical protein